MSNQSSEEDRINRSVDIENRLINIYVGKQPLPTRKDCLIMALRLGTPREYWGDVVKNHVWGE